MSMGMDAVVAEGKFTRKEVKASHWALWQTADEVNTIVTEWIGDVLGKKLRASL
jgi:hypothetical protein